MSNPLILHGTQIALPRPRPAPHPNSNPLPCIPEGNTACPQPNDTHAYPQDTHPIPGGKDSAVTGPVSVYPSQRETQPFTHPVQSALTTSVPSGSGAQAGRRAAKAALAAKEAEDSKVRTLNADERLKRLKVRMQHTIQAYSGDSNSAAGAGRYSRSQSLTAASPHAAYRRTNSSPVRASRVSVCVVSQKASDETSSCYSSSSSSSAATLASMESSGKGAAPGGCRGGAKSSHDEQHTELPICVPHQRGIHQVAFFSCLSMCM
ncbi:hypothetical protein ABBQ32_008136 [Trebouxia sp. C0010 RCD-2024]